MKMTMNAWDAGVSYGDRWHLKKTLSGQLCILTVAQMIQVSEMTDNQYPWEDRERVEERWEKRDERRETKETVTLDAPDDCLRSQNRTGSLGKQESGDTEREKTTKIRLNSSRVNKWRFDLKILPKDGIYCADGLNCTISLVHRSKREHEEGTIVFAEK